MFLEPVLIYFLLRYLRNSVRKFSPNSAWERILTLSSIGIILLFVLQMTTGIRHNMIWIWDLILLVLVWITFKFPAFENVRQVMYVVLPLTLLSIFNHIVERFFSNFYDNIDQYINFA